MENNKSLEINLSKLRYFYHVEIIDTKTNTGIFLDRFTTDDYKKIRESLDTADEKILNYNEED